MACTIGIPVPFPVLPAGFTIDPPALPPIPVDLTLCCKLVQFTAVLPPIPLGSIVVNPAFIAALTAGMKAIQDYLDAIPLICPKE